MVCKVCGNDRTVKSHLIPRSIFHDMRGRASHLRGFANGRSIIFQAGAFDRQILCQAHEDMLCDADTYGTGFLRRFAALAPQDCKDQMYTFLDNPRPDLLLDFACAVVWRHGVSAHGSLDERTLSPWDSLLKDRLFLGSKSFSPVLVLERRPRLLRSKPIAKTFLFSPIKLLKTIGTFDFAVNELEFLLNLHVREHEPRSEDAGSNNPVGVANKPPQEIIGDPRLVNVVDRHGKPRRYPRR